MDKPIYQHIATLLEARANCEQTGNTEWFEKHGDRSDAIMKEFAPHGSGFDQDVTCDDASANGRLLFNAHWHAMNDDGFYCGWIHFQIIVSANMAHGIDITVTVASDDRDDDEQRNDPASESIADYVGDTFHTFLFNSIRQTIAGYRQSPQTATPAIAPYT